MNSIEVAITGGIGSGKSYVCAVFECLGTPVYYADIRAKYLVNHNSKLKKQIKKLLGEQSYINDIYDTKFVADTVFGNQKLLSELNAIIHPAVEGDYKEWVNNNSNSNYLIKESALVFELDKASHFYKTILITADKEIRIERLLKRDPWRSVKDIKAILAKQLDDKAKIKKADIIINTNGSELILPQIVSIHESLLKATL